MTEIRDLGLLDFQLIECSRHQSNSTAFDRDCYDFEAKQRLDSLTSYTDLLRYSPHTVLVATKKLNYIEALGLILRWWR